MGTFFTLFLDSENWWNYLSNHICIAIIRKWGPTWIIGQKRGDSIVIATLKMLSKCWSQILANKSIGYNPIVFHGDSFYVVGGQVDGKRPGSKTIARFDTTRRAWSESGELFHKRAAHNAIFHGSSLIVVGGNHLRETERCEISNGQTTCTAQNPELDYYADYPELFLVPVNFCSTLT